MLACKSWFERCICRRRFIKQFCKQHQIPCYVKQLDLSKIVEKGKSIQSEARDLRYQWFDEMMSKINADVLLTAHHLNDQLETIFIAFLLVDQHAIH